MRAVNFPTAVMQYVYEGAGIFIFEVEPPDLYVSL